jgi:hypothetical protein
MSTERLVRLAGISEPASTALLRTHRPDNVRLSVGLVIRDQRPMDAQGWPSGRSGRPQAEFLFGCTIPTQAPYVIDIAEV